MKLFKNLSIRQLTLYVTFAITIINGLMILCLYMFASNFRLTIQESAILLLGFVFNFFVIVWMLDLFVFRKIKVIYKMIKPQKLTKTEKDQGEIGKTSLNEVEVEVEEWTRKTNNELASMKSLEKYRKDYVGNISHELKTPIFSIQGYLHTLLDGGMYDEKVNINYLKRAISNADRLQNIVEDLEIISRLESEEKKLNLVKFDLKLLTVEVIEDIELMASAKNMKIIFKDGASQAFNAKGDREMIRQVLNNLIVNAIKYGKEDGIIKISFYDLENMILTEISDNGIGIDENHLKHLFDRFYRVESSRSRKIAGSGLGLSIVKHIIEAHTQSINVRSTPGLGSTFGFTLDKA